MREVEFISDYTKFKKGDKYSFDSGLALRLVDTYKVAKYTSIDDKEVVKPKAKK